MQHSYNNFDFLRLIFALFVLVSHSYPLSGMEESSEWLYRFTNNQLSFSNIGVPGFFIISGYLIYQSLERSKNLKQYYIKRFLRLFPSLIVVLILTVLLAPFVYENQNLSYLHNNSVWSYFPNNISLYNLQVSINGVFDHNPYKSAIINGSLWTIPYEFTLYIAISTLYFIKKGGIKILIFTLTFIVLLISNYIFIHILSSYSLFCLNGNQFVKLSCFFVSGSYLATLNFENWAFKKGILIISMILFIIAMKFNITYYTNFIILPIIVLTFGTLSTPIINKIGIKIGDLSYGVYIYGFVVQQTIEYFYILNYINLMISSILVSLLIAFGSWHLIEKRALNLKKVFHLT